ncbi:extracellular solute-binding protein [Candidatus Kaiserbacteria bacterium]|nr:MAG: extracellular solute-binding protein [Candidatus Kaiserbacteria bacterium]
MQEKRNPFQIVILGVFIFFIVVAVLVFASFTGGNNNRDIGEVTVWGSFDEDVMEAHFRTLADENSEVNNVKYREVPEDEFQVDLVEALANGTGPDLFILDQSNLLRHWNKVQSIPYETISEREFKDTYIDEAEIFLSTSAGIKALPLLVDPLVLYWNRDIFAESGFSQPPQFWDELFLLAERITQRDKANNIGQATIAFGEFDNVNHAKDIISALILQAGGSIVTRQQDGQLTAALSPRSQNNDTIPAQTALRFYTEFADPVKSVYTWNRSLTNSLDAFAQGKLALYVGYASEVETIKAKNAHINFDVAPLPQIRSGEQKKTLTFGKMYALAVPKAARNVFGGTEMALYLTGAEPSRLLAEAVGIPSPRRDILSKEPSDPLDLIFRNAALISRAWLDPHAEDTNDIFRRMVGDVTSGSRRLSETIQRADEELRAVINR